MVNEDIELERAKLEVKQNVLANRKELMRLRGEREKIEKELYEIENPKKVTVAMKVGQTASNAARNIGSGIAAGFRAIGRASPRGLNMTQNQTLQRNKPQVRIIKNGNKTTKIISYAPSKMQETQQKRFDPIGFGSGNRNRFDLFGRSL